MLPGKKDIAKGHLFRTGNTGVLPLVVAGITAETVRIGGSVHPGHFSVKMLLRTWKYLIPQGKIFVLLGGDRTFADLFPGRPSEKDGKTRGLMVLCLASSMTSAEPVSLFSASRARENALRIVGKKVVRTVFFIV